MSIANGLRFWLTKSSANRAMFRSLAGTWTLKAGRGRSLCPEEVKPLRVHAPADDGRQVELGKTVMLEFQNQGLASEAMRALLDSLFRNMDTHRAHVSTDHRNGPSLKVFERVEF